MIILETRAFTARLESLLSDEEYRFLQTALIQHPEAGTIIPGTGGLRKLRWSIAGRGKKGGARIIYFWHPRSDRLLMLFIYAKNEASDLTADQRAVLRKTVESEYP